MKTITKFLVFISILFAIAVMSSATTTYHAVTTGYLENQLFGGANVTVSGDLNVNGYHDADQLCIQMDCISAWSDINASTSGGGGSSHIADFFYLYNDSTTIYFNESKLNATITALDTATAIGNCSGADCNIGWGNLTSVPTGLADGDDNTEYTNLSWDLSQIPNTGNVGIGAYDLTVDTNTFFVGANQKKVGIGTASPRGGVFDVWGVSYFNSTVNLDDNLQNSPILYFTDETNEYTALMKDDNNHFYLATYGDNSDGFFFSLSDSNTVGSSNDYSRLIFGLENTESQIFNGSEIRWTLSAANAGSEDMELGFYTAADGGEPVEALHINEKGNTNFTNHNLTNVNAIEFDIGGVIVTNSSCVTIRGSSSEIIVC